MLYLVDASVYVFRAYFSIPDHLTDPEGRGVNAVYGFTKFMLDLIETENPSHLAVAFDESLTTSFRNQLFPDYKANREKPPQELKDQFELCKELIKHLGAFGCQSPEYEADDLIGSLLMHCRPRNMPAVIVTRDKDLAQLLTRRDVYLDYAAGKRLRYDDIATTLGVPPPKVADWLALTGDAVDNIPGVPGIGPKTATALLSEFDSLDELLANTDAVAQLPIRGAKSVARKLDDHAQDALLARSLTIISRDAPVARKRPDLRYRGIKKRSLKKFFDRLGFGATLWDQARELP